MILWEQTAALLGVSRATLWSWRKSDPAIDVAYNEGRQELAEKISTRLIDKALAGGVERDPETGEIIAGEEGNTQALIHVSKHVLGMTEKTTQVSVSAQDIAAHAGGSDPDEGFRRGLDMLGLGALMPPPDETSEDLEDEGGPDGD